MPRICTKQERTAATGLRAVAIRAIGTGPHGEYPYSAFHGNLYAGMQLMAQVEGRTLAEVKRKLDRQLGSPGVWACVAWQRT